MRWNPSSSADVDAYQLSVWTDVNAANAGVSPLAQIDIPLSAAGTEATNPQTILYHDIQGFQLQTGVTYYLRMRAHSSAGLYSVYSNRIDVLVAAATTMSGSMDDSGSSTSGTSGSASGTTSGSGSSSSGSGGSSQVTSSSDPMTSVDLDGASEYLATSSAQLLGIADRFTLSLWARSAVPETVRRGLVAISESGGSANRLELMGHGPDLELVAYDGAGELAYQATYSGVLLAGEWQHLVVAYDAQLDTEPAVFVDGVLQAASGAVATGSAAVFTDSPRRIYLGTADPSISQPWRGTLGHAALWDEALGDVEIQEMAVRGHTIDLRQETGAYRGNDALVHYWRLGFDPAAPGLDYGPAGVPLDLDDPNGNIDASDVTPEAPVLMNP